MKTSICSLLCIFSITCSAMRCGNDLIDEGDSATKMRSLCGEPTAWLNGTAEYTNKDNDGLNYILHIDNDGTIERIDFTRG